MQYALEGLRVIDLAQLMAGPGVSFYLGDQGADVIKVEPRGGDVSRRMASNSFLGENGRTFMVFNRSKRGMTLDIQKPEGKEVLSKLIMQSDVLISNFRNSTALRLGLDYPSVQAMNPRLIYASVTGYGNEGPYAEKPAYDRMTQGFSGAMVHRDADGAPLTAGVWISDCSVPMLLAYGVMTALWAREKTGLGQKVETSLLQTAIAMQASYFCKVLQQPGPAFEDGAPSYGIFRCSDDRFLNVGALLPQHFQRLCMIADLPHLADDPRFSDPERQEEFRAEVFPVIEAIFTTKTADEWQTLLDEAVIPCAPVLTRAEVFDEPQMVANEMFTTVDHPKAGPTVMMAPPVRLSETPGGISRPAPLLGQHTEEVLLELGYTAEQIADLREKEVV
jgi:crotonobetainyl-CoA:carnitine CoA-transferase CaiB-like acyl-CoA transferase